MSKKRAAKPQESPQESALQRFSPLLSAAELERLLAELQQPLEPAFRTNPLKAGQGAVQAWAQRYGWELRQVAYCPEGWKVSAAQSPLSQTIEHRLGAYYLQDAASMLPVELFDWDDLENPLVLDLAASPGGKTTHLIARMGDRGLVMANDSSADRITALRLVLQNWGGLHQAVTNFHGEKFGAWFPDSFDRVLIDAPCSMQGLRSTEAHPMRAISARERGGLAQRQLRLLESALRAARPGGQVVYSTCTLEPEEDEGVIDGLLRAYPGQVQVDDLARKMPVPASGLLEAGRLSFAPEVQHSARLWPHLYHTAGFFAARLTKLAPSGDEAKPYPGRPISLAGWQPLDRKARAALCEVYLDSYGVDLGELCERLEIALWQRNEKIYAFPEMFLSRFGDLPVQGLGLLLGEDSADGLSLSHEWVARFGSGFERGRVTLGEEAVASWLRGEDIPGEHAPGLPAGRVVAVFDKDGRLLGRGKLVADRLKNLLPRRLF
jgi:16S rRNA (cytosine1407-C5)-methyltransferase